MTSWDMAVMAMVLISTVSILLSEGEKQRVRWIQAMRRCLLRMNGIIRYEQPELPDLLERIDLRTTPQERKLTSLLHACAQRLHASSNPQLMMLFAGESARLPEYGVLSEEDRAAFEGILAELGRVRLPEQIRLLDSADERLRAREETLTLESKRRARMIRTLGVSLGAAAFLILI